MIREGLCPSIQTFMVLAKAYLRARPVDTRARLEVVTNCLALFGHMKEENVAPTVEFFNCVLAVCVRHGRATDAFNIYNQMQRAGVEPDIATHTTLMYNCAENQVCLI